MKLNFYEIVYKFTDSKGHLHIATLIHGEKIKEGIWLITNFGSGKKFHQIRVKEERPVEEITWQYAKTVIELSLETQVRKKG